MRILFHITGLGLCICLFLLGSFIVKRSGRLATALTHTPDSNDRLCKFFQLSGGTFKVVASIGGLLESVSVVVLTSGVLIDVLMGL
jgi:hypothetical protein